MDGVDRRLGTHGDSVADRLLDVRGTKTPSAAWGWTREAGDLWETIERLHREGCARDVVTDVSRATACCRAAWASAPRRARAHPLARRRERRCL